MKLPLEIRRKLHKGPAEFDWPLPTPPGQGRIYRLQANDLEWTFAVVAVEVLEDGWRVCARLHSDPIRLLGRKSGYTDTYALSLRTRDPEGESEPEAVDELTQKRFDQEGRRKAGDAAEEAMAAAKDLRQAVDARAAESPNFRKLAGPSIHRIQSELDRVVANAQRRSA